MDQHQQKISLNVHLQVPPSTVTTTTQDGSHTPNTPEILNTIVNMTAGPFASPATFYPAPAPSVTSTVAATTPMTMEQMQMTSPMDSTPSMYTAAQESPTFTDMSMDTTSSNLSSPSTPGSSMSVQAYTSQFIKEGLKFKMRQRMGSGSSQSVATGGSEISPFPSPVDEKPPPAAAASATAKMTSKRVRLSNLTPDDQMRRMRRRERNKIAATKCRNKKKARTVNLVKESEILDTQNKSLKIEISKLETEKDRLMGILQQHEPSCAKKLKEVMKARHPSGGFEFYPPAQAQQPTTDQEFRAPLPPPPPPLTHQQVIPSVKITPPVAPENDPPTFAEAIRMVSEIKEEQEEEELSAFNLDGYFSSQDFYQQNSFLAKRNLGQTYLDLDSRCIAL